MNEFRTPTGLPFCMPKGQIVLLESITYVKESTLFLTKKESGRGYTYFKVKGYGMLTLECEINDLVALVNPEDVMPKAFGFPTEVDSVVANLNIIREELDHNIPTLNELGRTIHTNEWKNLMAKERYIKLTQYALTNEHNISFSTDIDTLHMRFIKFCKEQKVTRTHLENIIDDFITPALLEKL